MIHPLTSLPLCLLLSSYNLIPYTKVTTARKVPERTTPPKTNATSVPTPTRRRPSNAKFAAKVCTKTNWGGTNANGALWGNFCPTKEVLPCFTMTQTIVKSVVRIRTPMKPAYGFAKAVWQTTSFKTVAPMKPCTTTRINAFFRVPLASIPKITHALIVKRGFDVKAV